MKINNECVTELMEIFPNEDESTLIQLATLEPIALGIQYVSSLDDCIRESNARYLIDELEFIKWNCNGVNKLSFENYYIRCNLYNKDNSPVIELQKPKSNQIHLYNLLLKWIDKWTSNEEIKVEVAKTSS